MSDTVIGRLQRQIDALQAENAALKATLNRVTFDKTVMLPDELLAAIFCQIDSRSLGRATQVCRRWREVAAAPVLTQRHGAEIKWRKLETSVAKPTVIRCPSSVLSLVAGGDGRLYAGGMDKTVTVWSPTGELLQTRTGHLGWVTALAITTTSPTPSVGASNSMPYLYSASTDAIYRWTAAGDAVDQRLLGHEWSINCLAAVLREAGGVCSGGDDKTVRVWSDGGLCTHVLDHPAKIASLAFTADGGQLFVGMSNAAIHGWDAAGWARTVTISGHWGPVDALCCGGDGNVYSAGRDKTARAWSSAGAALATLPEVPCSAHFTSLALLRGGGDHGDQARSSHVCSTTWDKAVVVWPVTSKTGTDYGRPHILRGHDDTVACLAVDSAGRLWSGSWDSTIRGWG